MKRTLLIGLIFLLALTAVAAYAETKVVVKDIITINVDKALVRTDVPPIVVSGQTLVPVRGVFNAFGAEIGWFPRERRVFVREDSRVIWIRIGDAHAKVNDSTVPLQVPAMIYRGRTMVPLRFIAETLGAKVDWNPSSQTITITTRERAILTPEPPAPMSPQPAPPSATPQQPPAPAQPDSGSSSDSYDDENN